MEGMERSFGIEKNKQTKKTFPLQTCETLSCKFFIQNAHTDFYCTTAFKKIVLYIVL